MRKFCTHLLFCLSFYATPSIVNEICLKFLVLIIVFFVFCISFSQSYFIISNSNSDPIFIPICQNCFANSIQFVIRSLYPSFPLQMDSLNRRKSRGQQTLRKELANWGYKSPTSTSPGRFQLLFGL